MLERRRWRCGSTSLLPLETLEISLRWEREREGGGEGEYVKAGEGRGGEALCMRREGGREKVGEMCEKERRDRPGEGEGEVGMGLSKGVRSVTQALSLSLFLSLPHSCVSQTGV